MPASSRIQSSPAMIYKKMKYFTPRAYYAMRFEGKNLFSKTNPLLGRNHSMQKGSTINAWILVTKDRAF